MAIDKNRAGGAMMSLLTGDWILGGLLGSRGQKADPTYDANIATGGAYSPTAYNNPTLNAYQGGANPNMDMMSPGAAESYWNPQTQQRTGGDSRTSNFAARQNAMLTTPGRQENAYSQYGSTMAGPSASEGQYGRTQQALAGPTATQSFRQRNQAQLGGPGQGEQHWNQVQGRFNQPTNSQSALNSMQANRPNFDAFYDRARERQAGGMNDQLAARGMYGSSAGMDQISEGMSDLNAQQANREFDATLQQQQQMLGAAGQADSQNQGLLGMGINAANQAQGQQLARLGLGGQLAGQQQSELMAAQGLLGNLAGQQDQMGMGRFNALMGGAGAADAGMLGRLGMGMQNMQAADAVDLQRLQAGGQLAQGAQQARQGRIGQGMGYVKDQQAAMNNIIGSYLPQMMNIDMSLLDSAVAGEMGLGAEAVNMDRYDQQANMGIAQTAINGLGAVGSIIPGMG